LDQAVIRRKLTGTQAVQPPEGGVERAFPLALARATRTRHACNAEVAGLRLHRYSLTELLDLPPALSLIALLEGPGEAIGVMMIGPDVLAALIEAQTHGHVAALPAAPRRPTRTDAAMVADWVDAVMTDLEETLGAEEDLVWTDGFRFASHLDEPRPLGLMLEDAPYRVLAVTLRFAPGREGPLVLALPAEGRGRNPQRAGPPPLDPAQGALFEAEFREQVMAASATVDAVLCRLSLPLDTLLGLGPGDMLPLPTAQLDRIVLEGADGQGRATGRLGQHRGMRALRLSAAGSAPAPATPVTSTAPLPVAAALDLPQTGTG
jgi:flagellar motor switch protein FliM